MRRLLALLIAWFLRKPEDRTAQATALVAAILSQVAPGEQVGVCVEAIKLGAQLSTGRASGTAPMRVQSGPALEPETDEGEAAKAIAVALRELKPRACRRVLVATWDRFVDEPEQRIAQAARGPQKERTVVVPVLVGAETKVH